MADVSVVGYPRHGLVRGRHADCLRQVRRVKHDTVKPGMGGRLVSGSQQTRALAVGSVQLYGA